METSNDVSTEDPVVSQAKQLLEAICEARPVLHLEHIQAICEPYRGGRWTREQEERVMTNAEDSDVRMFNATLDGLSKSHLEKFVKVYRVCMRLYHMSPLEMLSPDFGINLRRGKISMVAGPTAPTLQHACVWSGPLLDKLYMMLIHPIFSGRQSVSFIILVLQFTSICRTRDQRPWDVPPLEVGIANPQLDAMRDEFRVAASGGSMTDGTTSPYSLLRILCQQKSMSDIPAKTSLLLRIIDTVLARPSAGAVAISDQYGCMQYEIYQVDIDSIITSLSLVEPPQVTARAAVQLWNGLHPNGVYHGHPLISTIVSSLKASYKHFKTRRLLKSYANIAPDLEVEVVGPSPSVPDIGDGAIAAEPQAIQMTSPGVPVTAGLSYDTIPIQHPDNSGPVAIDARLQPPMTTGCGNAGDGSGIVKSNMATRPPPVIANMLFDWDNPESEIKKAFELI